MTLPKAKNLPSRHSPTRATRCNYLSNNRSFVVLPRTWRYPKCQKLTETKTAQRETSRNLKKLFHEMAHNPRRLALNFRVTTEKGKP